MPISSQFCSIARRLVRSVIAALLALGAASGGVHAASNGSAEADRLLEKATTRGTVRVLVRLDVPARPEAVLSDAQIVAQRDAMAAAAATLAQDLAGTEWRATRVFRTIPYLAIEVAPDALSALARSQAVLDVAEDRLAKATLRESVPLIGADRAWDAGYDGTGWAVAVLDTGVSSGHPFLAGKVVSEACFSLTDDCPNGEREQVGPGAGAPCAYARHACPHGTHVAGIAAGRNDEFAGVGRGAGIIAIQVFSRFTGRDCDDDIEDPCAKSFTSDTIAALEHVYQLRDTFKIAAANLSLGGGGFASQEVCDQDDGARKAVIDNLRAVGIATVAAAGNEGTEDALSAPGCISSAISVGAVSKDDQVVGFSNSASFLALLAPGLQISSSVPPDDYESISGTSQATPHVAGAFAVLSQRLGRGDVDAVSNALRSTGVPVRDPRNHLVKPRIAVGAAIDALPRAALCQGRHATIVGTEGPDRIVGTRGADVIAGLGGADLIDGGPGDDVICGGRGDDTVRGGAGSDELAGDAGNDVLRGGSNDDLLLGGPGNDRLAGEADDDILKGGPGDDVLLGGSGNDRLAGQQGADSLVGASGSDSCEGGAGLDESASCETLIGVPRHRTEVCVAACKSDEAPALDARFRQSVCRIGGS